MPRRLAILALIMAACMLCGGGCSRKRQYSQDSPDETIRSAAAMIKNGDTHRLSDLIYAESPEMRAVLNQLGKVLGSMQSLSVISAKKFPAEFKKLQDDALAAAEDPKNKSLVSQLMVGMTEFGGGDRKAARQPNSDDIRNAFSAILADPFGWIDRNAARITTIKTADDAAGVLFDGQPAIPGLGLPMRLEKGRWYIALPLNVPPISGVMPRSRQQWSILGSVLKVTDNAMVDLTKDVEAGRVSGLKHLTDKFQEKVLFPIAIAFASYAKELDVRGRTDRALSSFRSRERAWTEGRRKAGAADEPGVSPKLLDAINALAPAKIERVVRSNKRLAVDKMVDGEFEELVGGWLSEAGLRVRFDENLFGDVIDRDISAWETQRKANQAAATKNPKK
jgi:hypothetical protein